MVLSHFLVGKIFLYFRGGAGWGRCTRLEAFANYDAEKVAQMTAQDVERLMQNSGIIRNKLKIWATITNAQQFLKLQKEFGSFCNYLRFFLPDGKPIINHWTSLSEIPPATPLSDAISKDMKKRGFKFFGTTICYAHLQAVGYVNDHLEDCQFKYGRIED